MRQVVPVLLLMISAQGTAGLMTFQAATAVPALTTSFGITRAIPAMSAPIGPMSARLHTGARVRTLWLIGTDWSGSH